ncbi:hypothetical protein [Kaistella sp.]|uniref:hypothetical protein n=1 Tax=Kaistella sp. TaxID=2782235 RepID=UPI003C5E5146
MENISIVNNDKNQYEISLSQGELPFVEKDFITIENENITIKSLRIGEVYTKGSGVLDAKCIVENFSFKKSDIINFSLEDGKNGLMNVNINLNNSEKIELVQQSNSIELTKMMCLMVNVNDEN